MSNFLQPHGLQHARPPCPSPTPGVHSNSTSIKSVIPSSHLILCRPLLLLPPIPPSIRVFSIESALRMRWPKYWSFSLSIIPCKEQAGFKKGRGTRDQITNIWWIIEKAREFQKKTFIFPLLTMPKLLTVWITINCGKFWNRWAYQTTWSASWEICMQVRKQQLELDMEQQTGSK